MVDGVWWGRGFRIRKTFKLDCNYLIAAFEVCGNLLKQHDCHSEEEVMAVKDDQISKALENLGTTVDDWGYSCKCAPTRDHIDRMTKKGVMFSRICVFDPDLVPATTKYKKLDFGLIS